MNDAGGPSREDTPAARQPRRRRRLVRLGAWGVGLPLLAAVALYVARERVLTPFVRDAVRSYLRDELGADVDFDRLGGDWYSELVVEGFRWRAGTGPLRRIDDASVRARFSLLGLARGERDAVRSLAVVARGVEVEASAGEDSDEPLGQIDLGTIPSITAEVRDVLVRSSEPGASFEVRVDSARAEARVDGAVVGVDSLVLETGTNRVEIARASVDVASDSVADVLRSCSGEVDLRVDDAGRAVVANEVPADLDARVSGRFGEGAIELSGDLESGADHVRVERAAFTLGRTEHPFLDGTLAVTSSIRLTDLAPYARLADGDVTGALEGKLDVHGTLRSLTGELVGRARDVVVGDQRFATADVHVIATEGLVEVRRFDAHSPSGFDCSLRGKARLAPLAFEGVEVLLDATDLRELVAGAPTFESMRLTASVDGPVDALRGRFDVRATGVAVDSRTLEEVAGNGTFERNGELAIVDLEHLLLTTEDGRIETEGRIAQRADDRFDVDVRSLSSEAAGVPCTLVEPVSLVVGVDFVEVADLALATDGGQAFVSATYDGERVDGAVRVDRFDTGPLISPFLPDGLRLGTVDGTIEGSLLLAGDEPDASAQFALKIDGLVAPGATGTPAAYVPVEREPDAPDDPSAVDPETAVWTIELEGALANGRASITKLEGVEVGGATLSASFDAPFDLRRPTEFGEGELEVEASFDHFAASALAKRIGSLPELTGVASGRLHLTGTWRALRGRVELGVEKLELLGANAAAFGACDLALNAELGERIVVERVGLRGRAVHVVANGTVDRSVDVTQLFSDPEVWHDAPLALDLDVDVDDMAWIAETLTSVRRLGGRANGQLSVHGVIGALDWSGAFEVEDAEVRFANRAPVLREVVAKVRVDKGAVVIERLDAEFGGAPVRIGGTVVLPVLGDDGVERGPRFDLTVEGDNLLLARTTGLRVRADAKLAVTGPLEELRIGGQVHLVEGRFARNIQLLRSLFPGGAGEGPSISTEARGIQFSLVRDPPFSKAKLDVKLTAGAPFEIDTNVLRASVRPELTLGGILEAPVLQGPIYIGASTVSLPSGRLRIRTGILEFREDDPYVPYATITADMNAQGYRVQARVEGPYDRPEIILTSDPPLANEDLLLLVLTGRVPDAYEQNRDAQAAQTVAVYFAQDALTNLFFTNDADSDDLLDRFEYEVGAELTKSGNPTGRALFYIGPGKGGEGTSTYIAADFDEYDDVNYGVGVVFRFR